jgi:class 3 adenylate cyclase
MDTMEQQQRAGQNRDLGNVLGGLGDVAGSIIGTPGRILDVAARSRTPQFGPLSQAAQVAETGFGALSAPGGALALAGQSPGSQRGFAQGYRTFGGNQPNPIDLPAFVRGLAGAGQGREEELAAQQNDPNAGFVERGRAFLGRAGLAALPYLLPVPGAGALRGGRVGEGELRPPVRALPEGAIEGEFRPTPETRPALPGPIGMRDFNAPALAEPNRLALPEPARPMPPPRAPTEMRPVQPMPAPAEAQAIGMRDLTPAGRYPLGDAEVDRYIQNATSRDTSAVQTARDVTLASGAKPETTWVFTDTTGSTKMIQQTGPGPMREVMAHQNAVLSEVFGNHDGELVRSTGDGFLYRFPNQAQAAQAAAEAQRRFGQENWRGPAAQVKIGMHSGVAESGGVRSGVDYVGEPIHMAARIAGEARPGEVTMSEPVARAIGMAGPQGSPVGSINPSVHLKDYGPTNLYRLTPGQSLGIEAQNPGLSHQVAQIEQQLHEPQYRMRNQQVTLDEPRATRVAQRYWSDNAPQAGQDRRALIVYGYSGAGKSTLARPGGMVDTRGYLPMGSDDFKPYILRDYAQTPEPYPIHGNMTENNIYRASDDLRGQVLDRAIRDGYNVVLQPMGRDPAAAMAALQDFKNRGYQVHVVLLDTPAQVAISRSMNRFVQHGGLDGTSRFIRPGYTYQTAGKPQALVQQLLANLRESKGVQVDGLSIYDGSGREPRLVHQTGADVGRGVAGPGRIGARSLTPLPEGTRYGPGAAAARPSTGLNLPITAADLARRTEGASKSFEQQRAEQSALGPQAGRAFGVRGTQIAKVPEQGYPAPFSSLERQAKVHEANETAINALRGGNMGATERALRDVKLLGGDLTHTAARIRGAGLPGPTRGELALRAGESRAVPERAMGLVSAEQVQRLAVGADSAAVERTIPVQAIVRQAGAKVSEPSTVGAGVWRSPDGTLIHERDLHLVTQGSADANTAAIVAVAEKGRQLETFVAHLGQGDHPIVRIRIAPTSVGEVQRALGGAPVEGLHIRASNGLARELVIMADKGETQFGFEGRLGEVGRVLNTSGVRTIEAHYYGAAVQRFSRDTLDQPLREVERYGRPGQEIAGTQPSGGGTAKGALPGPGASIQGGRTGPGAAAGRGNDTGIHPPERGRDDEITAAFARTDRTAGAGYPGSTRPTGAGGYTGAGRREEAGRPPLRGTAPPPRGPNTPPPRIPPQPPKPSVGRAIENVVSLPKSLLQAVAPLHAGFRHLSALLLAPSKDLRYQRAWIEGAKASGRTFGQFAKDPLKARGALEERLGSLRENLRQNGMSNVEIRNPHGGGATGEELIPSNLPNRIPGLGRFFEGGQAGFAMFLNEARYATAKFSVDGAARAGKPLTAAEKTELGNIINHFTGRGFRTDTPLAQQIGRFSAIPFFSPQLQVSYARQVGDTLAALRHPTTRPSQAAMQLATGQLGAIGGMMLGASALGLPVILNMTDSNFGKIDLGTKDEAKGVLGALASQVGIGMTSEDNGHVYLDPTHGMAGYVKALAQTLSRLGQTNQFDPLTNLLINHLSPGLPHAAGELGRAWIDPRMRKFAQLSSSEITPITVSQGLEAAGVKLPAISFADLAKALEGAGAPPPPTQTRQPLPSGLRIVPIRTPTPSGALRTAPPAFRTPAPPKKR